MEVSVDPWTRSDLMQFPVFLLSVLEQPMLWPDRFGFSDALPFAREMNEHSHHDFRHIEQRARLVPRTTLRRSAAEEM
jgi:hypothetical protein